MAATPIPVPEPLPVKPPPLDFKDPCSFSAPGQVLTQHIHLQLHIDLTERLLTGVATLKLRRINPAVTDVVLDARGLSITSVTDAATARPLSYSLLQNAAPIGDKLTVSLPANALPLARDDDDGDAAAGPYADAEKDDGVVAVVIAYTTTGLGADPVGGAIDWLAPAQAAGRPFAFTQAQAIHARSLLPCQDTPAAKAPYSALITLDDANADLTVVMSAQRLPLQRDDPDTASRFECRVPVPSYLFAFAVGRLSSRDLSTRCRVWALPGVVDKAAWEFHDVENLLATAERIAGPYVWGRYDLLVLPASFPYGGMENPMLTFVTPTLLSGDRSLVSVVIHEIAHSWSGNLVSCRDCRHFWVNEGFTVKLERRVVRELYGDGHEGLDALLGREAMNSYVNTVGLNDKRTSLVTPLKDGEDPDDYFSCIPYEKGYNLLMLLEQHVRADYNADFHQFLHTYFERFRYQAVTSDDFVSMFRDTFPKSCERVDFNAWLHGTGMCPEYAQLDTGLATEARGVADKWVATLAEVAEMPAEEATHKVMAALEGHAETFRQWGPKQQRCLLAGFGARVLASQDGDGDGEGEGEGGDARRVAGWDARATRWLHAVYGLDDVRNSELRMWWCRLCLAAGDESVLQNVKEFVSTQGRMKFVRPLFNELHTTFPRGEYARELFAEVRESYHSIAAKMIERDLAVSVS